MNPLPEISFGSVPPLSASEQQRIIYQQQLTATHLQPWQHQHYVQARQQMNSQQQQPTHLQRGQQQQIIYQQQQQIYHHQQQMYQQPQQQTNYQQQQPIQLQPVQQQQNQQQQPTLLHPGQQQQQFNYQLQQAQQQLNYQLPQQEQQPTQLQPRQQQRTQEETRTLWVGGLRHWMDEAYLYYCFPPTGHVCAVQLIWNKQSGYSEGYGFVEFTSQAAAQRVLLGYNGLSMPHTECQPFRLQWAYSQTGQTSFRHQAGPEYSLSEGNLAPGVTDRDCGMLQETLEAGPECSLLAGDSTPNVKDCGMLEDTPKAGPECSHFPGDLFRTGYPLAKQELVKPEVESASPTNSAIEQTTEEIASPLDQVFALPDICAKPRNDIDKNQLVGFGSFRTDLEFVREEYESWRLRRDQAQRNVITQATVYSSSSSEEPS